MKCAVKDCKNFAHQGKFIGLLCAPCHAFISEGDGLHSQAFRNERRMIDLAVKIWRDFASKLERELIATRERAEKAEAELAALRERLASWDALERMADNARELGLDYDEPVKEKK